MAEASIMEIVSILSAGSTVHQATKGAPGLPKPVDAGDPDSLIAKRKAQRDAKRRRASGRAETVLSDTLG
jgi:hypothetical protein